MDMFGDPVWFIFVHAKEQGETGFVLSGFDSKETWVRSRSEITKLIESMRSTK